MRLSGFMCLLLMCVSSLLWASTAHADDGEAGFTFGGETSSSSFGERFTDFEEDTEPNVQTSNIYELSGTLEVSAAGLPKDKAQSGFSTFQGVKPVFLIKLEDNIEIKLGVDLAGYTEHGSNDFKEYDIRYDENYIRYKDEELRLTLGAQKIAWGRTDEIRPTDQLSGQDLRRYVLSEYDDRKLAVPALRAEYFAGEYKVDIVSILQTRDPELAEHDSMWSIVNLQEGRFFGAKPNALFQQFAPYATFGQDENGFGGVGARFSKSSPEIDYALTVQRIRQTSPFYEVNSQITDAITAGTIGSFDFNTLNGDALKLVRPWSWVIGGDLAVPVGSGILRLEAAWMDYTPVHGEDLTRQSAQSYMGVAGYEFYPGDGDMMVLVQLTGNYLESDVEFLQRKEVYTMNGTIEQSFFQGQWVANLDYSVGLGDHDVLINPRIAYRGIDDHEFFAEAYLFGGTNNTAGGLYRNNSMFLIGWIYKF